ncbi:hypothetical protein NQZ68_026770 [Dissostichus eleginoides]|nr:hypothetical protein NQZ68_026770 [Dissostichus eleginoides]
MEHCSPPIKKLEKLQGRVLAKESWVGVLSFLVYWSSARVTAESLKWANYIPTIWCKHEVFQGKSREALLLAALQDTIYPINISRLILKAAATGRIGQKTFVSVSNV